MYIHPTQAPSYPTAQAAKAARIATRSNPNSTDQQKKDADAAYVAAMRRCLRECGTGG
jgi:hypothetical protein